MNLHHMRYIYVLISVLLLFRLGHGGSDGLHAYVHSLDDAVTDVVRSSYY